MNGPMGLDFKIIHHKKSVLEDKEFGRKIDQNCLKRRMQWEAPSKPLTFNTVLLLPEREVHVEIGKKCFFRSRHAVTSKRSEDCFYYCSERNNVVILFGTLKVQSFILTEVSDCGLLIVVTSSTFLKRKDMLKAKSS